MTSKITSFSLALLFSTSLVFTASAREIKTNTAQMQAMDKITGKVQIIEVPVGGEYRFGTFSIVARDCQTRPPEEAPENFAFIDVVDINFDGTKENIFKGWMISSSPALNAIEHPVFDVWLLKCIDKQKIDKNTILSKEELETRETIAKRVQEVSHMKIDLPDELIEDDAIIAVPEGVPTVAAIEYGVDGVAPEISNPDTNIIEGIGEEALKKKLEEMGIDNSNSSEVIVSGFTDESDVTPSEDINESNVIIDTPPTTDEVVDDSPKSLINFKKLSGE